MDQRELKCQICVLGNNVSIFIVLLSQGYMNKDYCGWRSGITILKEKTFREIQRFISPGSFLYITNGKGLRDRPETSPSLPRENFVSLPVSDCKGEGELVSQLFILAPIIHIIHTFSFLSFSTIPFTARLHRTLTVSLGRGLGYGELVLGSSCE